MSDGLYSKFVYKLYGWPTELTLLLARVVIANVFWQMGPQRYLPWPELVSFFKPAQTFSGMPVEGATAILVFVTMLAPLMLVGGLFVRLATLPLLAYTLHLYLDVKPQEWQLFSLWGIVLLLLLMHGAGRFSADAWLRKG